MGWGVPIKGAYCSSTTSVVYELAVNGGSSWSSYSSTGSSSSGTHNKKKAAKRRGVAKAVRALAATPCTEAMARSCAAIPATAVPHTQLQGADGKGSIHIHRDVTMAIECKSTADDVHHGEGSYGAVKANAATAGNGGKHH